MDAVDGTDKGLAERSKFTDSSRATTLRGSETGKIYTQQVKCTNSSYSS